MNIRSILKTLGPGFITGASDDDPSGILTYAQTGAKFGYRQLWTTFLSIPFMIAVQEMCGRIGLVTGKGLASVIKENYPRPVLFVAIALLFTANVVNIGADLGAMAASAEMLSGVSFWLWLGLITIFTLLLEIFVTYALYARFLKYLTLSLLAYVAVAFIVKQDWVQALHGTFVPEIAFDKATVMNVVAVFGTTISPYLFFWQADEEVEEEVARGKLKEAGAGKPNITPSDITEMRFDTSVGMVLSNLIAFFIMITAASTLRVHGITEIETAADAAKALEPIAGPFAAVLFAAGVIGTGLLAVPVLAGSASYALSESLGWKASLGKTWRQAPGFYVILSVAVVAGALINVAGIPPFRMLYLAAILNGLSAPALIALVILISRNEKIMGKYRSGRISLLFGVVIALFMALAAVALVLM